MFSNLAMRTLLLLLVSLVVTVAGCTAVPVGPEELPTVKADLANSSRVSSAQGRVVVSTGLNNSNVIDLTVKRLPHPSRLKKNAKIYIVWELPAGTPTPQSLGALSFDKNSNGHLKTLTPFHTFDLFITAELRTNQTTPTGEKLLWINVSR